MPVHDWTRVSAGTFHDFHCSWIPEIKNRLNKGDLPSDYYAQVEQVAGEMTGGTVVTAVPPRVRFTASLEMDLYAARARQVVIRHSSGDRIVALIEVVSPGNKASRYAFQTFVDKTTAALSQGYHLLLIDLFPPGPRDPQGIHGAVWSALGDDSYVAPPDKPLTLVAYAAGLTKTAYIEPLAVGDPLTPMPLFLMASTYVAVPLEESYQAAYSGVPRRWRQVLEGTRS